MSVVDRYKRYKHVLLTRPRIKTVNIMVSYYINLLHLMYIQTVKITSAVTLL